MTEVARRHAPGLLVVGALSGAALGLLVSQLAGRHEALALTMGGATLGVFLAVLLDALCSRYHVADVLPWGARVGCLGAGAPTLLLLTVPSIMSSWMSGRNSNPFHFVLAAEPHVVLLLIVCFSGAISGAMAAAFAAASAVEKSSGRREMVRSLLLSLSGYVLGLSFCVLARSVQFGIGISAGGATSGSALLHEWAVFLDRNTLSTLSVGWLAAGGCWILAGPRWQWWPGDRRQGQVQQNVQPQPTKATVAETSEVMPNDEDQRRLKAAILARMSARRAEDNGDWSP